MQVPCNRGTVIPNQGVSALNLLLDAHAFLWFVLDDPQPSPPAMAAIQDSATSTYVSPASRWEIAIKISLGRYVLRHDFETFWSTGIPSGDFLILPVSVQHTAQLIALPFHHKDPFDRLLVAQSLVNGFALVSADRAFDAYGVTRVW
jgi:PIN domain nuclease of toxin-antitoxin system